MMVESKYDQISSSGFNCLSVMMQSCMMRLSL